MGMLRPTRESYQMNDNEKSTFQAILEKYDASSMSNEDKKSMFEEIRETGIRPNREMKEMLESAGFQPPARPQGLPPQAASILGNGEMPDFLQDFITKFREGSATVTELNQLLEQLMQNGLPASGNIIDENS